MSQNQTIDGVPRKSLEQALKLAAVFDDGGDGADAESARGVVWILRALLDAPAVERKPFGYWRVPKSLPLQGAFFPWIDGQSEKDVKNALEHEFGFYVRLLYDTPAAQPHGEPTREELNALWDECHQGHPADFAEDVLERRGKHRSQGEPVAWLNVATGQVTTSAVVVMDWDDEKEQVQSLYAEQPAPVAVVLPERLTQAELEELEVIEAFIHGQGLSNLAGTMAAARQFIDEVTRLNPSL